MQKSGIIPNRITEFNLASAFAPCPSLAADLVLEARALRHALCLKRGECCAAEPASALVADERSLGFLT